MVNLINITDFNTDYSLPFDSIFNDSIVNEYIPKFQKKYLIDLLGYTLYKEFETGLNDVSPDQKWIDLRDGKDYSDNGNDGKTYTVNYEGLKPFLVPFCFYEICRELQRKITTVGQVQQMAENSMVVDITGKAIEAFNNGLKLYGNDFLNKLINSAYNFIHKSNEVDELTYPNWLFTELNYKSYFII